MPFGYSDGMSQAAQSPTLSFFDAANIDGSIKVMREAVIKGLKDPETRLLASCIIGHCDGRHDLCEITAIWDFVQQNVKYVADPRLVDTFQTLRRTLQLGFGDCDDMAIADATLLEAIGFQTYFRVVETKGAGNWNHVYACVGVPKRAPTSKLPLDHTLLNAEPGVQPPWSLIQRYKDHQVITDNWA